MLRPYCKIIINGIVFPFCHTVEIHSTWEKHTDTAKIVMPKRIGFVDSDGNSISNEIIAGAKPTFKRGDPVEIWLGYVGNGLKREFLGVISNVSPHLPLTIECEDLMWNLKQTQVAKMYKSVNLQTLLKDILPAGTPFQAVDTVVGSLELNYCTVVDVFNKLAQPPYGIQTWVRDGKVYCGLAYYQDMQDVFDFVFQSTVISDELVFTRADDLRVGIRAVNITSKGKRETITLGDGTGKMTKLKFHNCSADTIKLFTQQQLALQNHVGYKGKFKTFGLPSVKHGDAANLVNPIIADENGKFLIKAVTKSFGVGIGYKQEIDLHWQLS